jgi:c-di-GMP-binding flagellar brake protein YcgR
MGVERRRAGHIRFPVRVPAIVQTAEGEAGRLRGETENLSQGGVLLRLPERRPPGAPVAIVLALRRRAPLAVRGTVVFAGSDPGLHGAAVGVRFDGELDRDTVADIAGEEFPPWEPAVFDPRQV